MEQGKQILQVENKLESTNLSLYQVGGESTGRVIPGDFELRDCDDLKVLENNHTRFKFSVDLMLLSLWDHYYLVKAKPIQVMYMCW